MSGSMRESLKALNAAFSASTVPDPLPDELYATIDAFLQRYDDIDDHDSQRFHDDLHALYLRHVANSPDKRGAFLSALRLLRPAITGEARLTAWWNSALRPVIDGIGYKKSEIEDARAFVQSILVYDLGEDHDGEHARLSALFTNKILDAYLARTKVPSDAVSPENEFIAHELEAVLVAFGRKMPKILLLTLDDLLVQKQHRIQALNLLSAFVRLQPPHLHLVLETPLVQNLEKCLLIDNSSTVIELALVVLIMFLPHICGALTSDHHLEKMFLVYCRILCWDKLGNNDGKAGEMDMHDDDDDDDDSEEEDEENHDSSEQAWEQVQPSMDYPASPPPTLMHYFTFLYGLFPLNFMSFVRKPRRYLKSLNFPGARDFDLDQDLIHSRTEPYRRVHLLHPNMFTTTVEDELSENRWLKSDPADVVVECMDLCVAVSSTLEDPGPPPNAALPPVPEIPSQFTLDDQDGTTVHDSDESWRNTQSTMNVSGDAPQIPDFEVPRSKSIKSAVSIKSMASPLLKGRDMMDSPTLPPTTDTKKPDMASPLAQRFVAQQPSLDSFAQSISGQTSGQSDFQNHTMASLQREIMLLRNDLNFERYLKLQHLAHIGQLQRKHIKEATAEAETQNLINTNKTLKAKLAKANELYAQLKKETLTSRSQSKKWESELNNKVRSYKESEKTWHSDEGGLRYELQRTQSDYEQLKKIVERAEAEQLKAQQRTKALEYELEDYSDIRRELESAQDKIIAFEDQRKELHTLIQERNDLRNDLEIANMRLNSREQDRERSIKAYERRIMELESRLQTSDRSTGIPGQLPSSVQQMLDSTLAASNAKMQQLKKTHYRLLEQYTELQMKYHDLEGEREAEMGQLYPRDKAGHVDFGTSRMSRNSSVRTANNYSSRYLTPLSTTEVPPNEEQEYYEYRSPESVHSPGAGPSPLRPARLESLQHGKPQRSQTAPSPYPGFGGNYGPDFSAAYDASLHNQFQAPKPPQSSGQSSFSADTDGSSNKDRKEKVEPKSEVRIYGRGGAQNIGKKVKEKEQKKPSSSKTGGFRGLKGIM